MMSLEKVMPGDLLPGILDEFEVVLHGIVTVHLDEQTVRSATAPADADACRIFGWAAMVVDEL